MWDDTVDLLKNNYNMNIIYFWKIYDTLSINTNKEMFFYKYFIYYKYYLENILVQL